MVNPHQQRRRDRRESDLLLNVVLAHMSYSSAKDVASRRVARERFEQAVHLFYDYVITEEEFGTGVSNGDT